MKNHLYLFLILLFPSLAFAQEMFLPLNLEIRSANEAKENRLIAAYGQAAYLACQKASIGEGQNPFALAKYLRQAEYCLQERSAPRVDCGGSQIESAGACVAVDTGCKERYGEFSFATGRVIGKNNECECLAGYVWDESRSGCLAPCPDNLLYYSPYRDSEGNIFQPFCKEPDLACLDEFGEFSVYVGRDDQGRHRCGCLENSEFDHASGQCLAPVIVAGFESDAEDLNYSLVLERERGLSTALDIGLSQRLAGRILLQVEERGEAWYVNPDDNYRYYLAGPKKAFELMRGLGLGVRHEFINAYEYYPSRVWGKILLDVDDLGKAYYIDPTSQKARYLGSPDLAYQIMRELGLGISNEDIRQIFAAEVNN